MSPWRLLVAAGCMAATCGYVRLGAAMDTALAAPRLGDLPVELRGWRVVDDGRLDPAAEEVLQADSYVLQTYTRHAVPVTLFVAYYATQRTGHAIHSPLNCLPGTGWEWIERRLERVPVAAATDITINRNLAVKNREQTLVYYWYQSRGRTIANEYWNKLFLVREALIEHRSDGALVRVTVPYASASSRAAAAEGSAFVRDVYPSLTHHLPG